MKSIKVLEYTYTFLIVLLYVTYFAAFIKIQVFDFNVRDVITPYITLFVALFLMARFNPFVKIEYTNFDKRIVFHAAMFLLISTTITQTYLLYITEIKQKFI
jgi:hypothetical protein